MRRFNDADASNAGRRNEQIKIGNTITLDII